MLGSTVLAEVRALSKELQLEIVKEMEALCQPGKEYFQYEFTICQTTSFTCRKNDDTFIKTTYGPSGGVKFTMKGHYVGRRGTPIIVLEPTKILHTKKAGSTIKYVECGLAEFVDKFEYTVPFYREAKRQMTNVEVEEHAIPSSIVENPHPENYGSW